MPDSIASVEDAIRSRRTAKVTTETDGSTEGTLDRSVVDEILATAGFAPFHHMAPEAYRSSALEPWRCHVLDAEACRRLRGLALEDGVGGKIPGLLAAASALVLVTWLPEGTAKRGPRVRFDGTLINMEHIAATGAMIQNILVSATARSIPSYWSSGGWLATDAGLESVSATSGELLLGAVFLFPSDLEGAVTVPGKHRANRSPLAAWSHWVDAAE